MPAPDIFTYRYNGSMVYVPPGTDYEVRSPLPNQTPRTPPSCTDHPPRHSTASGSSAKTSQSWPTSTHHASASASTGSSASSPRTSASGPRRGRQSCPPSPASRSSRSLSAQKPKLRVGAGETHPSPSGKKVAGVMAIAFPTTMKLGTVRLLALTMPLMSVDHPPQMTFLMRTCIHHTATYQGSLPTRPCQIGSRVFLESVRTESRPNTQLTFEISNRHLYHTFQRLEPLRLHTCSVPLLLRNNTPCSQ